MLTDEKKNRIVFVEWEEDDNSEGSHHAYVYTQIEGFKTLPHKTYLCGLKVSDHNIPLNTTLEYMQQATGNKNPFPRFCEKCIEKLKQRGLFDSITIKKT